MVTSNLMLTRSVTRKISLDNLFHTAYRYQFSCVFFFTSVKTRCFFKEIKTEWTFLLACRNFIQIKTEKTRIFMLLDLLAYYQYELEELLRNRFFSNHSKYLKLSWNWILNNRRTFAVYLDRYRHQVVYHVL